VACASGSCCLVVLVFQLGDPQPRAEYGMQLQGNRICITALRAWLF
jgi:hypothetical protein